jgi:enoyl-CoA hydratase
MAYELVLTDDPAPRVRRVTLNRPEKRNALNHTLRGEVIDALQAADRDPEIAVQEYPFFTAGGDGQWPRHVVDGWMGIWDLAKPVIAQVHSYCLAGGSELATGCDLVYVAEDAQIGYPAVRFGVPDMQFHSWLVGMRIGMEMMVTGDSISGTEAARLGWATRAYPEAELETKVLEMAQRIAQLPSDIVQLNKRAVHRQMEAMGIRTALRAGTEVCTLATHQRSFHEFMAKRDEGGLTQALQQRDAPFGDYRTTEPKRD